MVGIAIKSILTAGTPKSGTIKANTGDASMTPSAANILDNANF